MQLRLKVSDLVQLEKLTKFVSKTNKLFENININNKDGRLVAVASNQYSLRQIELSDNRLLTDINTSIVVDVSFKNALKVLIAEYKKSPDQIIDLNERMIGADDLYFSISYSKEPYPDYGIDNNCHSYFSVNLKALKLAIESMSDETAFVIVPSSKSDRVVIRGMSGEVVMVGVKCGY